VKFLTTKISNIIVKFVRLMSVIQRNIVVSAIGVLMISIIIADGLTTVWEGQITFTFSD